jgi:callose synthase
MTFSNHLFIVFFAAIFRGYQNFEQQKHFYEFAQALADLKFTYVVSCQVYGNQKKSGDPKDQNCYLNIQRLLLT